MSERSINIFEAIESGETICLPGNIIYRSAELMLQANTPFEQNVASDIFLLAVELAKAEAGDDVRDRIRELYNI